MLTLLAAIVQISFTESLDQLVRGKSEKALKINFRGFKFCNSNQYRGIALLHK